MSLYDLPLRDIDGQSVTLAPCAGQVLLAVNVASRCGLTPQYEGLERLQKTYADQGFSVLGFPSNQFQGQEPGTPEQIKQFCSLTFGVTFPMYDKIDVNGPGRHPLYAQLTETPDSEGSAGDVEWNFEKFLIGRDGTVLARFRPDVEPEEAQVTDAIRTALGAG